MNCFTRYLDGEMQPNGSWGQCGAIQSDEANDRGHAELAAMLRDQALRSIEGSGNEEGKGWVISTQLLNAKRPEEPSPNWLIHTQKQKSLPLEAKLLILLVGDTWIEHVTPAV